MFDSSLRSNCSCHCGFNITIIVALQPPLWYGGCSSSVVAGTRYVSPKESAMTDLGFVSAFKRICLDMSKFSTEANNCSQVIPKLLLPISTHFRCLLPNEFVDSKVGERKWFIY